MMKTLILASASPRRQELLKQAGIPFHAAPSRIDEVYSADENPETVAVRLAGDKLKAFLNNERSTGCHWVLAADTFVHVGSTIFGKPESREEAEVVLRTLSGKSHAVYTGLAIYSKEEGRTVSAVEQSTVEFLPLSDSDIEWYLDSGEWQDAAGGYKVQGKAQCLIKAVHGSVSNIMGLPLHRVYAILKELGYRFS
jgi:septum formation protein